jgi:hypothetical protein
VGPTQPAGGESSVRFPVCSSINAPSVGVPAFAEAANTYRPALSTNTALRDGKRGMQPQRLGGGMPQRLV